MSIRVDNNFGLFGGASSGGGGGGSGTVQCVVVCAGQGICITGSPITTVGTICVINTAPYNNEAVEILGTGTCSTVRCAVNNVAFGDYSAALGGQCNCSIGSYSGIVGGLLNCTIGNNSFIGGGCSNLAQGLNSVVGGGLCNFVCNSVSPNNAAGSVVVGGVGNNTLGGTYQCTTFTSAPTPINTGSFTFIGGGIQNRAVGDFSAISGGCNNVTSGIYSTIIGGLTNCAIGSITTIGGGTINSACGDCSTISGGRCNIARCVFNTIGGGIQNTTSGCYSTILGGCLNCACADNSVVGGGRQNCVLARNASITGGFFNSISVVGGGCVCVGCGIGSYVGGGLANRIYDDTSTIDAGILNLIGSGTAYCYAATNTSTGLICICGNQTAAFPVNDNVYYYHNIDKRVYCGRIDSSTFNAGTGFTEISGVNISAGTTNATGGYIRNQFTNVGTNACLQNIVSGYANTICSCCLSSIINGQNNIIQGSSLSSIDNGLNNKIIQSPYSTILNGESNCHFFNEDPTCFNLIGGGCLNYICDSIFGVLLNGCCNRIIKNNYSTLLNGCCNDIFTGCYNFLGTGTLNKIDTLSCYNIIVGGCCNCTGANRCYNFIGGGACNTNSGYYAVIVGGLCNVNNQQCSIIGGGLCNCIIGGIVGVLGGGRANTITANVSFIGGGFLNKIESGYGVIGGGESNCICQDSDYSNILGGCCNTSSGYYNTIVGGCLNCIQNTTSCSNNFIGGGASNCIICINGVSQTCFSSILGGRCNIIDTCFSSILGGQCNCTNGFSSVHIAGSNIVANRNCATYVNNLNIVNTPVTCNTPTLVLARDTTGEIVNKCFSGGLSSVGLVMPSAFNVSNSPITSSGNICVTGAGLTSQYIRGDGSLATFPITSGGGGGAVFYFNACCSQGLIGGNQYYQMSSSAVIGSASVCLTSAGCTDGTPFARFITDAGVPNITSVPSGVWTFNAYLKNSANQVRCVSANVLKYCQNLGTCSTIGTGQFEALQNCQCVDLYTFSTAVNTTSFATNDRVQVDFIGCSGGDTITLFTQNGTLSVVNSTIPQGISSLNGLTASTQSFITTTNCTDFCITSAGCTHCFNLPTASASNRGALSTSDWSSFNCRLNCCLPAYSFYANATASAANATTFCFRDSGEQTLPIACVCQRFATSAMSGTCANTYRWFQVGKMVTLNMVLCFANAATNFQSVAMTLPSDVPTPVSVCGFTGACAVLAYGAGNLANTAATISNNGKSAIMCNDTNTGFAVCLCGGVNNPRTAFATITYITS